MQAPQDELSLREIVTTLRRHRNLILAFPLVLGLAALIYGFFFTEPRYASMATLNVSPVQVQAQLEQRIQLQGQNVVTFEGLKAIAFSEEVTKEVWETLKKESKLPTVWQNQGHTPGLERMVKSFKIKNESSRQQAVPQGQVPPVVASLTVEALTPEVAARAANLWAEAVTRRVNRIPLARLGANLEALEEQIAPAERAYREIQARWEAFQRASTLAQDKAELDAKTGEWVSLDQALSGLEQDLAGVAGRVRVLQAKESQQAAFVPAATNPEQLAMIGRKLRNAQLNLKQEVDRAQQSYVQAAKRLEAYRKNERLAEWQGEQDRLTQRFSEIALRLAQISTEVQVRQARLHEGGYCLGPRAKVASGPAGSGFGSGNGHRCS
ncbi:Wzz/FepE/Etk N-terminal domain-containing protein [Meiothermus granaticius]|nr:Wzz/FepE/Etk N-terminal domain-containing protein [Meiothermus granaticius]